MIDEADTGGIVERPGREPNDYSPGRPVGQQSLRECIEQDGVRR